MSRGTMNGAGVWLSRREALRSGGQAAAMLALAAAAGSLGGCSGGRVVDVGQHQPLVEALAAIVNPGAETAENVDFVLRAVDTELMKVPRDLLDQLAERVEGQGYMGFLRRPVDERARGIAALDAAVFASANPRAHPWYATKALILMSYYTSEQGMAHDLRYELVPGRYDNDVIVDDRWRPLSNDWSGVSVKKPIRP